MTGTATQEAQMFPLNYSKARERFLEAVASARGDLVASYQHPLRGPEGEKLFLDVVEKGPSGADRTLVLASGTHGVEGLVGSAIQTALLTGQLLALPADVKVIFLHAINPYGMAWLRRANEDGVDLNRNFIDFNNPPKSNEEYTAAMADSLAPPDWDGDGKQAADQWLTDWIKQHGGATEGIEYLKRVVPRGQYAHWHAPFYGGWAPCWSNWTFRRAVRAHLTECSSIVFIDYHSGLGARGTGQLIARDEPSVDEVAAGCRLWGDAYVGSSQKGTVAYPVTGDLLDALHAELAPGAILTSAFHEFGTNPPIKVLEALRFDHYLHVHGSPDPSKLMEQKAILLDAFCPNDQTWQASVLDHARVVIAQALSR